jgi:hypothetical protein
MVFGCRHDIRHNNKPNGLWYNGVLWFSYSSAECQYAECQSAECHGATELSHSFPSFQEDSHWDVKHNQSAKGFTTTKQVHGLLKCARVNVKLVWSNLGKFGKIWEPFNCLFCRFVIHWEQLERERDIARDKRDRLIRQTACHTTRLAIP